MEQLTIYNQLQYFTKDPQNSSACKVFSYVCPCSIYSAYISGHNGRSISTLNSLPNKPNQTKRVEARQVTETYGNLQCRVNVKQ